MNICYSAVLLVINGPVHLFRRECNWALIGKKVALVEFYWGVATGSVFLGRVAVTCRLFRCPMFECPTFLWQIGA